MKTKSTKNYQERKKIWLVLIPIIVIIPIWVFYGMGQTLYNTTAIAIIGTVISWCLLKIKKQELLQGIWTSLGILGTFVALVIAFKDTNLFVDNEGKLQLENLLPYLSSAFTTSIVGISVGLFFSIRNKVLERKTEEKEDYLKYPPEKILFDIKTAIEQISSNISQDLSKMMGPFFEGFNTAVFENLEPVLEQSKEALKSLNDKIETQFATNIDRYNKVSQKMNDLMVQQVKSTQIYVEKIETTLNDLVDKLSKSLDEVFGNNIDALDKTFGNLKEWQNLSKTELETITSNFREAIEQNNMFKDRQTEILEQVKKQLKAIEDIRKTKGNEIKVVEIYDEKLTELINRIAEINKVINQLEDFKHKIENNTLLQIAKTPMNGSLKINGNKPLKFELDVQ